MLVTAVTRVRIPVGVFLVQVRKNDISANGSAPTDARIIKQQTNKQTDRQKATAIRVQVKKKKFFL